MLAQRLVRRLCAACSTPDAATADEARWLGGEVGLRRAHGCARCEGTGYTGRVALSELFLPDDSMAQALREGRDLPSLRALAEAGGFQPMDQDGRRLVREGVTTIPEIQRTCRSHRFAREEVAVD